MPGEQTGMIVVGIDGSQTSRDALDWAVEEAIRSHRNLRLVHAWQWSSDVLHLPGADAGPGARKDGRDVLEREASHARHEGLEVSTHLVAGPPAEVVLHASEGADMVVVGSHGRKTLPRAFLGSVSNEVVRTAGCPVVVVPSRTAHRAPAGATAPAEARRHGVERE